MRVLVAEDDRVSALILKRVLEELGHQVDHAATGPEAWAMVQAETYDIIVSDWMMPEIDGLELCRLVRSMLGDHYTYFILLTGKSEREARIEALAAGLDDFLVKPLDREDLQARLVNAKRILDMQTELRRHSEKLAMTMKYLETANRRFSDLFVGLPVASITFDTEGRIVEWNRCSEALYQLQPMEVWQEPIAEIIADTHHAEWAQKFVDRALAGECIESEPATVLRRDGSLRHVLYSTFPLRGSKGEILGAVCTCSDMTERLLLEQRLAEQLRIADEKTKELAVVNAKLEELATTDGLTGLKNKRYYTEVLAAQFALSRRNRGTLSIVLCDIDHFKQFNDTFGHPEGDRLLQKFAGILKSKTRAGDLVARYGGEEFVVLLPDADDDHAMLVAEKLRSAIERAKWELRPITASFGVSTLDPSHQEIDHTSLVSLADRALYASKHAGRNRTTHANTLEQAQPGTKAA